jgi:DNA-binding MarR family transcriptional regulator
MSTKQPLENCQEDKNLLVPSGEKTQVLMELLEEVVAVHLRLQMLTEELHGSSEVTRACRGILRDLYRIGPRTVPQLARNRPVSRQNVLLLVRRLAGEGLVELIRNPDHKRSQLVRLTDHGKDLLEQMWGREMALLNRLELTLPLDNLRAATQVLHQLRSMLEDLPLNQEEEERR